MINSFAFLFGLQILLVTARSFKIVGNTKYFGPLLRIIKLIIQEVLKFGFVYLMTMIGVLFGLWFISGTDPIDDGDGTSLWDDGLIGGLFFIFEIFIGSNEVSAFDTNAAATVYLVIASVLGTLVLLNLLIAIMNAKYEKIQDQAYADIMLNQIELSFDYSRRSRHMPPPLNIIVYIGVFIIWIFNFLISIINIILGTNWNIFKYIHYDMFEYLRNYSCWCHKQKDNTAQENKRKNQIQRLKYFQTMNRFGSFIWHSKQLLNTLIMFLNVILMIIGCVLKVCAMFVGNVWSDKYLEISYRFGRVNIVHKGCYGVIKIFSKENNQSVVDAVTMSTYVSLYEDKRNRSISRQDRDALNKLTSNILFCQHCFQSFLNRDEDELEEQLVTPIVPLLDFVSTITFVLIPIAWIPLLIIAGFAALKDSIFQWFDHSDYINEGYLNRDYDQNYFPKFVSRSVNNKKLDQIFAKYDFNT